MKIKNNYFLIFKTQILHNIILSNQYKLSITHASNRTTIGYNKIQNIF